MLTLEQNLCLQGVLPRGNVVAIKLLFVKTAQGHDDFLNEVVLITGMKHRNLVNLKGCCLRGSQKLLVYEYVDNFDLDQVLLGKFVQHERQCKSIPLLLFRALCVHVRLNFWRRKRANLTKLTILASLIAHWRPAHLNSSAPSFECNHLLQFPRLQRVIEWMGSFVKMAVFQKPFFPFISFFHPSPSAKFSWNSAI